MHLSNQWFFSLEHSPEYFGKVPEKFVSFELPPKSVIDLDNLAGASGKCGDECLVFNEFDLEIETDLAFGAGADWWFECFLNGQKIYSTLDTGNGSSMFSCDDHIFTTTGRRGRNLLTFLVRRGMGSWNFCCGEKDVRAADPCFPLLITVDPSRKLGPIRAMNAVNNGPIKGRSDQTRGNLEFWKVLKIPFARNHDAAFCAAYGGEHSVDVHNIFPDFFKDPEDPASYDFTLTDRYIATTFEGGTETFYRLGSKIEHAPKKYGTKVPPDFGKWAVICEHIIRHYNEGWANGFKYNLRYWEIWNEPDLSSDQDDKKTWQGTDEEFFEFYRVAASHLKKCFPQLKIGGPALAGNNVWMKKFLTVCTTGERVPLDFFSWHIYAVNPRTVANKCRGIRQILDDFGFTRTESILNEWNYVRGWGADFIYSIETIIGMKGAAFTAAVMATCQSGPVDMLMYYDARPCVFNGLFDYYTYRPLKTYYVFVMWAHLAALGRQIAVDTGEKNGIFAVGAAGANGERAVMISRYFEEDDLPGELPVTLAIPEKPGGSTKLLLLDEEHDLEELPFTRNEQGFPVFAMKANSVVFLEQR